jgi:hypothetical protein
MEADEVEALARAAGLDKAVRDFPEDVVAAAGAAEKARNDFSAPADPTAEPWPPMRMKSGL